MLRRLGMLNINNPTIGYIVSLFYVRVKPLRLLTQGFLTLEVSQN